MLIECYLVISAVPEWNSIVLLGGLDFILSLLLALSSLTTVLVVCLVLHLLLVFPSSNIFI